MNTNPSAHILLLPAASRPRLISGDFQTILADAHTTITGPFARTETIFDEWLIYSDDGMADQLPLNTLATFLAAAIRPGQYIAGDAFIVGQSRTDPFTETPVDDETVERLGSTYALLRRAQHLSLARPAPSANRDGGAIEVFEYPDGTDLHATYRQRPLRVAFLTDLPDD